MPATVTGAAPHAGSTLRARQAARLGVAWVLCAPYLVLLPTLGASRGVVQQLAQAMALGLVVAAAHRRAAQPVVTAAGLLALWVMDPVILAPHQALPAVGLAGSLALTGAAEALRRRRARPGVVTALAGLAVATYATGQFPFAGWGGIPFASALVVLAAAAVGVCPLPGPGRPDRASSLVTWPLLAASALLAASDVVKPVSLLVALGMAGVALAVVLPGPWARLETALRAFTSPVELVVHGVAGALAAGDRVVLAPIRPRVSRVVTPTWPALGVIPLALAALQVRASGTELRLEWLLLRWGSIGAALVVLWGCWPRAARRFGWSPLRWSPGVVRRTERALRRLDGPAAARADHRPGPSIASRRQGRRDLAIVATVALAVAAVQIRWIWINRGAGNLDLDEAHFVAAALQFRNLLVGEPSGQIDLWYGPVLPLLSALALLVGPLDVRLVLSVQPLVAATIAVSATGIARRLTSSGPAIVAGLALAVAPVVVSAGQIYLTGPPAAAALTAAVWALLASRRGLGPQVWLVGPLLATAALSRTMTFILMPPTIVAALLYASTSARGARRVATSVAVGVLITCRYYLTVGWPAIQYVSGGLSSDGVQEIGLAARLGVRIAEVSDGVGNPLLLVGLASAAIGAALAWREGRRVRPLRGRPIVVPVTIIFGGWAGLLLGGYYGGLGFWDFPLIPLLVVVLVAAAAHLPTPAREALGVASLGWLGYLALVGVWILPYDSPRASGGLGRYDTALFQPKNGSDPRLADPTDRSQIRQATDEWWEATKRIHRAVAAIDAEEPGAVEVAYAGGSNYISARDRVLAQLERTVPLDFAGTFIEDGSAAGMLETSPNASERVLLIPRISPDPDIALRDRTPAQLQLAREADYYLDSLLILGEAERAGWTVARTIPLPLGDEMLVLRAPGR